ncbi:MAG: hypothetical protein JO112_08445, partial [Planctomycetes bacterium]|nr:hypothetical protein [Planctomycetota bacterium]
MSNFWRRIFQKRSRTIRREPQQPRRQHLYLELLEDRTLPSGTMADAPLSAIARPVSAVEGQGVSNVQVATFTDADPNGQAGDYTATIQWGDGDTSAGSISAGTGDFVVTASKPHPYAEEGSYTVSISIHDVGGATTDVTTFAAGAVSTLAAPVGLDSPQGLAIDGSGNLYVANLGNNSIRNNSITKITPAG